jgi:hypothetical protein
MAGITGHDAEMSGHVGPKYARVDRRRPLPTQVHSDVLTRGVAFLVAPSCDRRFGSTVDLSPTEWAGLFPARNRYTVTNSIDRTGARALVWTDPYPTAMCARGRKDLRIRRACGRWMPPHSRSGELRWILRTRLTKNCELRYVRTCSTRTGLRSNQLLHECNGCAGSQTKN